jgi:hypothetical protein
MLRLYGLPPRLSFEQGGHANCKICSFPPLLLFIVALPRLHLDIKFRIFRSLALILRVINSRQFPIMQHVTVLGRVAVTVVESNQRLING